MRIHNLISRLSSLIISVILLAIFFTLIPKNVYSTSWSPSDPGYGTSMCRNEGTFAADGTFTSSGVAIDIGIYPACTSIDTGELGFKIPSLGDLLTFVIRAFFVFAGLAALFYMLLGAFAWVTSGGDAEAVGAAQQKIQAAVVGMLIIVGVLAIIWTLEQVIFNRRICLGLSCPLTLPGLVESQVGKNCCICIKEDGSHGEPINTYIMKCDENGKGVAL